MILTVSCQGQNPWGQFLTCASGIKSKVKEKEEGRMKNLILIGVLPLLISCFAKMGSGFNPIPDKVISKSVEDTPDWVDSTKTSFTKEHQRYVVGKADIPGDTSPEKGVEVASLDGKAKLISEIKLKLEQQVQSASEGLNIGNDTLNKITALGTKIENVAGLFTSETYYEKWAMSDGYNQSTQYKCFSLVGMDLNEYRRQINIQIANSIGNKELSESFKKKVEAQWDGFFSSNEMVTTHVFPN
jgi:hypothetical protein